ncbi:MAG: hypothetical protein CK423_08100 [Legionella sp.]|nr:MAG: hypothetical protein CK423_08100 [Legionella sp.]
MDSTEELVIHRDKITICIYFRERDITSGKAYENIPKEVANVRSIQEQFTTAARTTSTRPAPEISVSVLVVPDWEQESSYEKPEYRDNKERVLGCIRDGFAETGVVVNDFSIGLSLEETEYLRDLNTGSNCLDMMKIKSIVANQNCRHLQLDSNTIITDYRALYLQTFSTGEQLDVLQCDALNASFYGGTHVTPHSKIVYTHPHGDLGPTLSTTYQKAIRKTVRKGEEGTLYLDGFLNGTRKAGLAIEGRRPSAILTRPEYRITHNVLTVTSQSWSNEVAVPERLILDLPIKSIHGISCNSNVIESLVKKYVNRTAPPGAHADLLAISNVPLEVDIVRQYINQCAPEHAQKVVQLISMDKLGNEFANLLFGCNAAELRARYELEDLASSASMQRQILPSMASLGAISNQSGTNTFSEIDSAAESKDASDKNISAQEMKDEFASLREEGKKAEEGDKKTSSTGGPSLGGDGKEDS